MKVQAAAAAGSGAGEGGSRLRRLWPPVVTALAVAFVGARFFGAVHDSVVRTRGGACTAMQPDPLPGFLQTGPTPDFQLPDAKGGSVSLSAQRGHPVL